MEDNRPGVQQHQLLILEALHIRKVRPAINTLDEVRSRELTLRL